MALAGSIPARGTQQYAGPLYVITTNGYISLPNAPFFTFYPEVPQP